MSNQFGHFKTMEELQQTSKKRDISAISTLQTTASLISHNESKASQEYCHFCNKMSELKRCACKIRIQCSHCKNWWIEPHEFPEFYSVKRHRLNKPAHKKLSLEIESSGINPLDKFDDYLLTYLLSKVGETGTSPHDLLNLQLVCKRFKNCTDQWGLANISGKTISWLHANWSEQAREFLTRCADAGSPEAYYFLGMICYYCMDDKTRGASLIERAAKGGHAAAYYSLAVIHFRNDESDKVGKCKGSPNCTHFVCTRWNELGRLDVHREMSFYLESDPYCFALNDLYTLKEWALEKMAKMEGRTHVHNCQYHAKSVLNRLGFYWGVQKEALEARKFIDEYWKSDTEEGSDGGLKLCSNLLCGQKERKGNEFQRCDSCGFEYYYCSNACREMHLKMEC